MADIETVRQRIRESEGADRLLYSCPDNPYESIYISAGITDSRLTVTDSECEHGPDGGWSHRVLSFDRDNSERVFAFLLCRNPDPFQALKDMLSYTDRTAKFREACRAKGIEFREQLLF